MAKHIYFVRHGESENNKEEIYVGSMANLTEKGIAQAGLIAERALHLKADVVLSSPFPRAHDTAKIISERIEKPLIISDLFIERERPPETFGMNEKDPEFIRLNQINIEKFKAGEQYSTEETVTNMRGRAGKATAFLENMEEQNIIVVTHGFFLKFLIMNLCFGRTFLPEMLFQADEFFRMNYTGLTTMTQKDGGGWYLEQWNDSTHLG